MVGSQGLVVLLGTLPQCLVYLKKKNKKKLLPNFIFSQVHTISTPYIIEIISINAILSYSATDWSFANVFIILWYCFQIHWLHSVDKPFAFKSEGRRFLDRSIVQLLEPRHEKTCIRGFRSGNTQTGLLSYRG